MNNSFAVHVLFRFSQKTGKIDTTMTSLGSALLQMWALNHTTKTKSCVIVERDTGTVVFATQGTDGFPKARKGDLGSIEGFGFPLEELQSIKDDRFD